MTLATLERLPRVARAAFALLAGALLPLAFDPFGFWFVAPLVVAVAIMLVFAGTRRDAVLVGYLLGLGMFGVGVSWISESFQYNRIAGPVVPFLTVVFVAFLALFPAAWAWLTRRLADGAGPAVRCVLAAPVAWLAVEWIRGWLFTGFTWLQLGYSQTDGPLAGLASVTGVYGLTACIAVVAGLLAWLPAASGRGRIGAALGVTGLVLVAVGLGTVQWTAPAGPAVRVALVQGNYPQDVKWRPENLGPTLYRYRRLTEENADAELVVWPETSIPQFAHRVEDYLADVGRRAAERGATVLAGAPFVDPDTGALYNSMLAVGRIEGVYHKAHLVPFGEYVPLPALVLPLLELMGIPPPGFTPWREPQPPLGDDRLRIGITICYEAAFGSEVVKALPSATILVNVSNDAWFGDTLAPHQHLQLVRMRAMETGRPIVRATNTGISAFIGPDGTLEQRAPQFETHVLRADVVPREGLTPYARFGDWPVMGLALALVIALVTRRRSWTSARSS